MFSSLLDCLDYKSFHGPKWRMEPSDLMVPVGLPEEEATLTCDAKGFPAPQYRYSAAFPFLCIPLKPFMHKDLCKNIKMGFCVILLYCKKNYN